MDIGPLAFQKAIVDAFFAGGLEAPGFSQAFEEYLMDSAVRARQKMPPADLPRLQEHRRKEHEQDALHDPEESEEAAWILGRVAGYEARD